MLGILIFVPELLLVSLFPGDLNLEITIEGLLYAPIYSDDGSYLQWSTGYRSQIVTQYLII